MMIVHFLCYCVDFNATRRPRHIEAAAIVMYMYLYHNHDNRLVNLSMFC